MPPKAAVKAITWTPEVELKFLLEIMTQAKVAVTSDMFKNIAEQWGEPHNGGSLRHVSLLCL